MFSVGVPPDPCHLGPSVLQGDLSTPVRSPDLSQAAGPDSCRGPCTGWEGQEPALC